MGTYTDLSKFYMPVAHESNYETALNLNWELLDTLPVNAKSYLKGDGTTEAEADIVEFAGACAGKVGLFTPGTYVYPDGVGLTVSSNTRYLGAGPTATTITVKDAYAFETPTTGTIDHVTIDGMRVNGRAGSVTGGAVKAVSNNYHAQWMVSDLLVDGVAEMLDPLVWVDGYIQSDLYRVRASTCGGHGILVDAAGFPSNFWRVKDCTVNFAGIGDITSAAIRVIGTLGGVLNGVISGANIEGVKCRGIHVSDAEDMTIRDNWFEANWNNDIILDGTSVKARVDDNHFAYFVAGHGVDAALRHILINTTNVNLRHTHQIMGNEFAANATPSGTKVEIGTNVLGTKIGGNRGIALGWENEGTLGQGQTIVDNGFYSEYGANDPSRLGAVFPVDTNRLGGIGLSVVGVASPIRWTAGTATPQGTTVAPPGSLYSRTNGTLWLKTTGTDENGWVQITP